MKQSKSVSRSKILELVTDFKTHISENKIGYSFYVIYSVVLGIIFPVAGLAAIIRKICIPFLIGFKNVPYIFWPVLTVGVVCNIIVDSTTIIFLLSTVGLHWTLCILPVIILSLMYIWTIDRVFVHKFRLTRIERIVIIVFLKKMKRITRWLSAHLMNTE